MLKKILVPLDGSERAERGLAMAARIARGSGGSLLLARIVSVPPIRFAPYGEPAQIALALIANARDEAEEYLKKVSASTLVAGISVESRTIEGHVSADILDTARNEQCDLIVICTHGHTGFQRWRLGRVADQVARHAPTPVLVVPARDAQSTPASADTGIRMLVTLDGSELAEAAMQPALDLAAALAAPEHTAIHLLEVVDFFAAMMADADRTPGASSNVNGPEIGAEERALEVARAYLGEMAQRIHREHPNISVTFAGVLSGDIAKAIGEIAEGQPPYDIIAMATHGRGGLQRWTMGSITERVLHTTHLPLLIARSPVAVAHDQQVADSAADAELHR